MRRGILIVLLSLGAVAGFTIGIARLSGYGRFGHHHFGRHQAFENHVAELCTKAAERVYDEKAKKAD